MTTQESDFSTFPSDVIEEIFRYLDHENLWRCLRVSRQWREIANTNRLWKIQCGKLGVNRPSHFKFSRGLNELCIWASTYVTHHLMTIRNWKTGKCNKIFDIATNDAHFIDVWEGIMGAVYYYKLCKLMVYEVDVDDIRCSELICFKDLPGGVFTVSIGLGRDYVAISNYNLVIVYKRNSGIYEPFKLVSYVNEELNCAKYNEKFIKVKFSSEVTFQVKTISSGYLWLSGNFLDHLYVVDVSSNEIILNDCLPYFRHPVLCPYVANWDDEEIKLYGVAGSIIFQSSISCWDTCFNKTILAIGNKDSQMVESWDIRRGVKLAARRVMYHTDIVVHPLKNLVILAEKSKTMYRIMCLDGINGIVNWQMFPPTGNRRCHDVKIISNYVFLWHSFFSRPKYSLLDVSDGKLVSEGLLPANKCHFSDWLCTYLDSDNFKIKSYLGFSLCA